MEGRSVTVLQSTEPTLYYLHVWVTDWSLHLRVTKMCPSRAIYVTADGHRQKVQPTVLRDKPLILEESQQWQSADQGAPELCMYCNFDENYTFSLKGICSSIHYLSLLHVPRDCKGALGDTLLD